MTIPADVRRLLAAALDWEAAHTGFARAVAGMPPELRGTRPPGFDHTCWELLEHLRLAQADILAFCTDAAYVERPWPDAYWPADPAPPDGAAWDASVAAVMRDAAGLARLALDESVDLEAPVPGGEGQTYLRELLLAVDHAAYHLGQLVSARKALGAWS